MRTGSLVWQALGHHTTPLEAALGTQNAPFSAPEETDCWSLGLEKTASAVIIRFHWRPFLDNCCNIAITLIDRGFGEQTAQAGVIACFRRLGLFLGRLIVLSDGEVESQRWETGFGVNLRAEGGKGGIKWAGYRQSGWGQ